MKSKFKIDWKIVLIIVLTIIFQCSCYWFGKLFFDKAIVIGCFVDDAIPFVSQFVYFYFIWFPLLVIVPYVIAYYDKEKFFKYITTVLISCFIAGLIFIFFPTTIVRYEGDLSLFSGFIIEVIYKLDTPLSCIPSIHVLTSFAFMLGVFKSEKIPKAFRVFVYIVAFLIILSTMFIKQHVFYDVISAILIVMVVWFVVVKTKVYEKIRKWSKI